MKNFLFMILAIMLIVVLALPTLVLNISRKLFRKEKLREYFKAVAFGFDQVGGSILYGQEDWMVSSWTYHLHRMGNIYATWFMKLIDLMFGINHCEESFYNEAQKMNFKPRWK